MQTFGKTLSESGLTPKEWVIGLWKGTVTKEDRIQDLLEYDELSREEIEKELKSYGEKKTYYIEITKDYLRYKFPSPLQDAQGRKIKVCNDISIKHSYTIKEGAYNGYDICIGDKKIVSFGKYNDGIVFSTTDGYAIYGVTLHRVTEFGNIDDDSMEK